MNKVVEDIYCFFVGLIVIFVLLAITPKVVYTMEQMRYIEEQKGV